MRDSNSRGLASNTLSKVIRKVRELEKLRDAARVPKAGQWWTVATWLTHWIDNIAVPPYVSENTHAGYRVDVEKHLIPGIGAPPGKAHPGIRRKALR
jgi:integrase